MSGEKDFNNTNMEIFRPVVKDLSDTSRSYILEDEDVSISFSFERKSGNKEDAASNEEIKLSAWKSVSNLLNFYG